MISRIKLQFLTAVILAVISASGCSLEYGRNAYSRPGTPLANSRTGNNVGQSNARPSAQRNATRRTIESKRNQNVVAQRGVTPNSTVIATNRMPNEEIPVIVENTSANSSHVRSRGISQVAHSESANSIAQTADDSSSLVEGIIPGDSMTLVQFEELALRNNPTIGQAWADVTKATALRDQVGRYPNPVVGYFGSQIADAGTDQHGVFFEQEIVRGSKLPLNQQIMRHAIEAQNAAAESQALRVLTDVRIAFFAALAAQEQIKLTQEFGDVASQGVEIASRRKDAQEGSQPELLQAQIQLSEIQLAHEQAQAAFAGSFRELAAAAGAPDLQPTTLTGDFIPSPQRFDWEQVYAELLAASPELKTAQARLQQACAQLQREGVQSIPNPTLQMGGGVDNATGSGLLNVQVSAPIPIHNSNRGNIRAARAEYDKVSQELTRIELAIKSRLAAASRSYDSALAAVRKYEDEILPKSKEALSLSEQTYRAGEIDFLQVFLVRRTYYDSNLRYVQVLSELAQARARIDGLLLEGGLDPVGPSEVDDSSRERVFGQK